MGERACDEPSPNSPFQCRHFKCSEGPTTLGTEAQIFNLAFVATRGLAWAPHSRPPLTACPSVTQVLKLCMVSKGHPPPLAAGHLHMLLQ